MAKKKPTILVLTSLHNKMRNTKFVRVVWSKGNYSIIRKNKKNLQFGCQAVCKSATLITGSRMGGIKLISGKQLTKQAGSGRYQLSIFSNSDAEPLGFTGRVSTCCTESPMAFNYDRIFRRPFILLSNILIQSYVSYQFFIWQLFCTYIARILVLFSMHWRTLNT